LIKTKRVGLDGILWWWGKPWGEKLLIFIKGASCDVSDWTKKRSRVKIGDDPYVETGRSLKVVSWSMRRGFEITRWKG